MFHFAGQSGSGPLMSNVRQHRTVCALPAPHLANGSNLDASVWLPQTQTRRALGGVAMNLNQQSKHGATGSLKKCKSLGMLFAQAVRASLLGPPVILRLLTDRCLRSLRLRQGFSLFFAPSPDWGRTGRKRLLRVLGPTLSSSSLRAYTRSTERQNAVLPNPSIEWTSTGWARYARCSSSASRAQPAPAPHVKR
jgi:hypothetical protein